MSFNTLKGFKNASYLTIGNIITQILSFFAVIYIARELGVSNYGIYITVGTFVSLFQIFLLSGMNRVIIREGSKNIEKLSFLINQTFALRSICIIIAIIICILFSSFMSYDLLTKTLIILHSTQLGYHGFRGILNSVYQVHEKMYYMSLFKVTNRLLFILLSIYLLYLGYGVISLFIVMLLTNIITLIGNYTISTKFFKFSPNFTFKNIDPLIIKSSLVFSLLAFVGFLTTKIDLLMISFLGGLSEVGKYGAAYKLVRQGMVLRNMTSVAFFPMIVKYIKVQKISQSKIILISFLTFIIFSIFSIFIYLFSNSIIILLFGENYVDSGKILKYLILFIPIWWAALPYTIIAQSIHKEKIILYSRSFMAILNIILNYILYLKYGLIGVVYSTLFIYYAGSLLIIIWTHRTLNKEGFFRLNQ